MGDGYIKHPEDYSVQKPLLKRPVAKITMNPSENITSSTHIIWDYKDSYHSEGLNIIDAEWQNKKDTYSEGRHTVKLRVKDENGVWSNWVSKTFDVKEENVSITSVTFTNAGATGRLGPTQAQINEAYKNTLLEGKVTSQDGIQLWTVPHTGIYRIEAYGTQGGTSGSGAVGGKGAIIKGEIELTKGTVLKILVGQQPEKNNTKSNVPTTGAAGGGGTFVVFNDNTPLLIAGGGGGGRPIGNNSNATTAINGKDGIGPRHGTGGVNGQGGIAGDNTGYHYGGGGGGFYSNGTNSVGNTNLHGSINEGGYAFINGGLGGNCDTTRAVVGGFGGGGYSGGGGGGYLDGGSSGGGGSFIHANTTNVATSDGKYNDKTNHNGSIQNLKSWNTGNGYVIISFVE